MHSHLEGHFYTSAAEPSRPESLSAILSTITCCFREDVHSQHTSHHINLLNLRLRKPLSLQVRLSPQSDLQRSVPRVQPRNNSFQKENTLLNPFSLLR